MKLHVSCLAIAVDLLMVMGGATARAEKMYSIVDLGTGTFTKLNNRGQAIGTGWSESRGDMVWSLHDGEALRELGEGFIPKDLNDRGQIVGYRPDPEGERLASLVLRESDGAERALGTAGHRVALNNRGQVMSADDLTTTIYSPWGTEVLSSPSEKGVGGVRGYDINDAGTVVGGLVNGYESIDPRQRWFMKEERGEMRSPATSPGYPYVSSGAYAINNAGQVIGWDEGLDGRFLFTSGEPVTIPFAEGWTVALNDLGQVVGYVQTPGGGSYPALYDGGQVFDLRDLLPPDTGWTLLGLVDLNNRGQILGVGSLDGERHSLLLTPQAVPEPGTLAIGLVMAGAGVAAHRRRSRMRRAVGRS